MTTILWSYIGQSLFAMLAGINSSLLYDYYCHQIICCNKRSYCINLFVAICRTYCNEIFVLRRPIASKFITTAHNDFVVIATIFPVVTGFFSCSVTTRHLNIHFERNKNSILMHSDALHSH